MGTSVIVPFDALYLNIGRFTLIFKKPQFIGCCTLHFFLSSVCKVIHAQLIARPTRVLKCDDFHVAPPDSLSLDLIFVGRVAPVESGFEPLPFTVTLAQGNVKR